MLFLFANLPSTSAVPAKTIALCQRLCLEFEHYLIVSHSLRKSFLSIKGIYYQATIQGQDILWLVPYKFVQQTSGDIDFRIMGTFVEFYTTLLGFVNFRLFTSMGLVYPPRFSASSDDRGAELGAFTIEGRAFAEVEQSAQTTNGTRETLKNENQSAAAQAEADRLATLQSSENEPKDSSEEVPSPSLALEAQESSTNVDTFEPVTEDADVLPQPQVSSNEAASLFVSFTFFLSRETPRQPLEFILKAFGCKRVGWDPILGDGSFTASESDPSITHHVVDRPSLPTTAIVPESGPETTTNGANDKDDNNAVPTSSTPASGQRYPNRTYLQPQWIWDCVNAGKLLRPDLYAPGATLPPHLSPWMKPKKGQYDPTQSLEDQEIDGEAEIAEAEAEERAALESAQEEDEHGPDINGISEAIEEHGADPLLDFDDNVEVGEGVDVADSDDSEGDDEEEPPIQPPASTDAPSEDSDWAGFDPEPEAAASLHQRELEAEAAGLPPPRPEDIGRVGGAKKSAELRRKQMRRQREEEEELERRKAMMSRKKRKALEKILDGNARRDAEAEKLRVKRRRIEMGGG